MQHNAPTPDNTTKPLEQSFDWVFIEAFANQWAQNICPIGNNPINFPAIVTVENNHDKTYTLSQPYDYVFVEIGDTLPSGETIVDIKPCEINDRWQQLVEFFSPLKTACENDDVLLLQKWLGCIPLEKPMDQIECPGYTPPQAPYDNDVFKSNEITTIFCNYEIPNIMRYLISIGLSPNKILEGKDEDRSLLSEMVAYERVENVRVLLEHNAKENDFDAFIAHAMSKSNSALLKLLLEHQPLGKTIPLLWNTPIYDLFISTHPDAVACTKLLLKLGMLEKPTVDGDYKGYNQYDIAIVDEDLEGFCKLIQLGVDLNSITVVIDTENEDWLVEANSAACYQKNPELLDIFRFGKIEEFAHWCKSPEFYADIRIPFGAGLNPRVENQVDTHEVYDLNLLTYALLNNNDLMSSYILESFDDEALQYMLEENTAPSHLAAVDCVDLEFCQRIVVKILELYAKDTQARDKFLNEMLVHSISTGNIEAFHIIMNKLKKHENVILKPKDEYFSIFFEVDDLKFINTKFLNTLQDPIIADCQKHWWLDAASQVIKFAIAANRKDIVQYFCKQPWFNLNYVMPIIGGPISNHPLDMMADISIEMFVFLLDQGLNPTAQIRVSDGSKSKTTTISEEIITHDRVEILAYILQKGEMKSARFNRADNIKTASVGSKVLLGDAIINIENSMPDLVNHTLTKGSIKCLQILFENGYIPFNTPAEVFLTLTKVFYSGSTQASDYINNKLDLKKHKVLRVGREQWPLMRVALYGLPPNHILENWHEQGVPVLDYAKKGKKILTSTLVESIHMLMCEIQKPNINAKVQSNLNRVMNFMLSKGPYKASCVHKCLIMISPILCIKDLRDQVELPLNALIDHVNKHKLRIPNHFFVSGYRGVKMGWDEIALQLDCNKPKPLKPSRPKQRRVFITPKKITPSRESVEIDSKDVTSLGKSVPVNQSIPKQQVSKSTEATVERLEAERLSNEQKSIEREKVERAEKARKEKVREAAKLADRQSTLLRNIDRLNERLECLEIRVTKTEKLLKEHKSYLHKIDTSMTWIQNCITGFTKAGIQEIDYGLADTPAALNELLLKHASDKMTKNKPCDELSNSINQLYIIHQKILRTQSALRVEKEQYQAHMLAKTNNLVSELKATMIRMHEKRMDFLSRYPEAKGKLPEQFIQRIHSARQAFEGLEQQIKNLKKSNVNSWIEYCSRYNPEILDNKSSEILSVQAKWEDIFNELCDSFANQDQTQVQAQTKEKHRALTSEAKAYVPTQEEHAKSPPTPTSEALTCMALATRNAIQQSGSMFENEAAKVKATTENEAATVLLKSCMEGSYIELAWLPGYESFVEVQKRVKKSGVIPKDKAIGLLDELSALKNFEVENVSECLSRLKLD